MHNDFEIKVIVKGNDFDNYIQQQNNVSVPDFSNNCISNLQKRSRPAV